MSHPPRYFIQEIIPTTKPEPALRSLGLASCHQVGPDVYVVGALGGRATPTVAVYNFQANSWRRANDEGSELPPNFSHASFLLNDMLYFHAGRDNSSAPSAEIFSLDLLTLEWTKCITSSGRPCPRFGHSGEYVDSLGKFVVFGGHAAGRNLGDLWELRVQDLKWIEVDAKGRSPSDRVGAASCVSRETIFLYGGSSEGVYKDDLYALDCGVQQFKWSTLQTDLGIYRCVPSLSFFDGVLVLFGGFDERKRVSTELFVFQSPKYKPARAEYPEGRVPSRFEMFGHTAIVSADGLYLFDGWRGSVNPLQLKILLE